MTNAAVAEVQTSLRGVVEIVFYSGATFSAGKLRTPDGDLATFAGKIFVREGESVVLEGYWAKHPKYGLQFAAESLGYDLEMDADGLANFLANHPDVKGIGPAKARAIADEFGRGFDAAIRCSPDRVAAIARIPAEAALALQRVWVANADFNAAMTYLSRFGLTHHQVTTLVERFGSQVVPILQRDPYVLVREIRGFGFKRVDKIARKMGAPKDLPTRIRAGLANCIAEALDVGDCWVEYEDLLDRANTLLVMDKRAGATQSSGPQLAVAAQSSANWRDQLLLNLNSTVKPLLANAITALRNAPEWNDVLAYDEFAHVTVLQKPAAWMKPGAELPVEWSPNDDILATEWLHHQGISVSSDVTGQAVEAVGRERPFHPVRAYLKDLAWDGVHRLES